MQTDFPTWVEWELCLTKFKLASPMIDLVFFLRQKETASFNQPIRMTRILWIRYFGGSLHTNSQNWWNNSKSKRWASILCLLTVQELICEKFAPVFKQCCSAGGKKKKRKGDKVHLVVEKVCRNMIAIMFIIFNGWVVGSRVTRQTNDRILVKWKNKSVKFCTVQKFET